MKDEATCGAVPASRRRFLRTCSAVGLLGCGGLAAGETAKTADTRQHSAFNPVALTDASGKPLTADALAVGEEYLFFYPYVCTPCFLLRLDSAAEPPETDGASNDGPHWPGGVGPRRDVVAFAAICSHKLTYPAAQVSFIGYRRRRIGYLNSDNRVERRAGVIQCCSEHSIYDPARGAKVLAGPAPQPLAAVALSADDDGALLADGMFGATVYERFFDRFGFKLDLLHDGDARRLASGNVAVTTSADYSRQRIEC